MNPSAYLTSTGMEQTVALGYMDGKGGLKARGFSDGNWDEAVEPENTSEQCFPQFKFMSEDTGAFSTWSLSHV